MTVRKLARLDDGNERVCAEKLIEYRTGCCLRRTLAAGRDSEDRCWGTMKMNDETVKGLLRKAGLKVTNQRMMVLDIMRPISGTSAAEEIYDLAKVSSPEIGLATIYRTVPLGPFRPACNRQSHI